MKIALVTETFLPSTDGVVTRLTNAVDYMVKNDHEVIIICPDIEGIEEEYNGAKIYPMPAFTFFFYTQRAWSLPSLKIKEIFEEFKPDIVHAVNPISLAASGVHYAKKLGIPLICSFHTNTPKYLDHYNFSFLKPHIWNFLKDLHNSAKINLVTSEAMHNLLEANGIEGLRVLPIGVDTVNRNEKFYCEKMRAKLTDGEVDKILLIFVGRLAPEKEIESLKELMDSRDDIRLAIIGDGPSRVELEDLFKDTNTVFTGFLKGEELSKAYASGDAFIFPSVSETLGLVITESMASGTPVIAAYSEPTIEQIKDRENGLIYQRNSLSSLNACIDSLKDLDLYDKIKQNGRKYAENFSWENASRAMVEAYEETII
ncbi:MAG: glycosyltransferase family 1 protein [Tissierellia bacterium]|nr:glycosyltransferase family 1 protein [Tissierellia bacterium]